MSGWAVVSALTAAAALWSWQGARVDEGAFLRAQVAAPVVPEDRSSPAASSDVLSPRVRRFAAAVMALLVLITLPAPTGWLAAPAAAVALDQWLARQPTRSAVAEAMTLRRQLPVVLELMAAALSSGATTVAAVVLAADGCGPPISRPLREVAASLTLGAAPDEAWRPALRDAALRQLGRLALRSAASGAAMAGACRDLAGHERQSQVVDAQVAVKRAGVLMTLPLALCFLPSFVLVGVVPIVLGLLGSLSL